MSIGGVNGLGSEVYYYNLEQNQAYVMEQNKLIPVNNAEVDEILAKQDIQVKNGKAYSISDGFEIKAADVLIVAGAGGVPPLPPMQQTQSVQATSQGISNAAHRLADSSANSGSMLFQQLMTLMRSARDDKETNSEMAQTLQSMKVGQMKGELKALEAQHKAENEADRTNFILNCVVQGVNTAVSIAGAAAGSSGAGSTGYNVTTSLQMASAALETLPAIVKRASYSSGKLAEKGEQSIRQAEFQKQTEIIQQALDMVKSGSDGAKKSFKSAVQLLQSVAERQNDNIKAMNG